MVELIKRWDGDCALIYGRPRHPQSQGLVEQANGTVEKMIAAAMEQQKTGRRQYYSKNTKDGSCWYCVSTITW